MSVVIFWFSNKLGQAKGRLVCTINNGWPVPVKIKLGSFGFIFFCKIRVFPSRRTGCVSSSLTLATRVSAHVNCMSHPCIKIYAKCTILKSAIFTYLNWCQTLASCYNKVRARGRRTVINPMEFHGKQFVHLSILSSWKMSSWFMWHPIAGRVHVAIQERHGCASCVTSILAINFVSLGPWWRNFTTNAKACSLYRSNTQQHIVTKLERFRQKLITHQTTIKVNVLVWR